MLINCGPDGPQFFYTSTKGQFCRQQYYPNFLCTFVLLILNACEAFHLF